MKTLTEYINEAKIEDFGKYSFDDICWLIKEYGPEGPWWRDELKENTVYYAIKETGTLNTICMNKKDIDRNDLHEYIRKYEKQFTRYIKKL